MTSTHQHTILIVDDSEDTLEMYALGLEFAGYRTVTASGLDSALAQLRAERPVAVVTDLQLGKGRGGWDLIDEMKIDPATRHVPVLVLTGRIDGSITATAERAGCVAVLTKPCLPNELADALNRVLPAVL